MSAGLAFAGDCCLASGVGAAELCGASAGPAEFAASVDGWGSIAAGGVRGALLLVSACSCVESGVGSVVIRLLSVIRGLD